MQSNIKISSLHDLAFDNSSQASIISVVSNGKIILANNAASKLFGYSGKELLTKYRSSIFDIKEDSFKTMLRQRKTIGHSSAVVTAIKKSGKKFPCEITTTIIKGDRMKLAIFSIADISKKILQQKKSDTIKDKIVSDNIILAQANTNAGNARNDKWKKHIGKTSYDVMWDWNIITGDIYVGESIKEVFGYKVKNNTVRFTDFLYCLMPAEKDTVKSKLFKALSSRTKNWNDSYLLKRADGTIAFAASRGIIIREKGKALHLIGAIQDISREQGLKQMLEQEINLKEQQILTAMEEAKETERSDIGKELHDNVNQLLGASRLYFKMAERGGPDREMLLRRSSEYTIMAIEEIRKLTHGLATDFIKNLGLCDAITNMAEDIMEVYPVNITCTSGNFKEQHVSHKFKMNIYRIVQEQINNIIKHAEAKEVVIRLSQNQKNILLSISDDGIGFDTSVHSKGIGLANIKSRATRYKGNAEFISQPGQGCSLIVTFPLSGISD